MKKQKTPRPKHTQKPTHTTTQAQTRSAYTKTQVYTHKNDTQKDASQHKDRYTLRRRHTRKAQRYAYIWESQHPIRRKHWWRATQTKTKICKQNRHASRRKHTHKKRNVHTKQTCKKTDGHSYTQQTNITSEKKNGFWKMVTLRYCINIRKSIDLIEILAVPIFMITFFILLSKIYGIFISLNLNVCTWVNMKQTLQKKIQLDSEMSI